MHFIQWKVRSPSTVALRQWGGMRLTVRIYEALPVRDWKTLADAGIVAPFGSPYLRIGNLKAFADGAIGSETAWMDEPFTNNPAKSGLASPDLLDVEHFYESMRQADKAGLQLTIHAIGDRANRTVLDLYGRLEIDSGPADRRRPASWFGAGIGFQFRYHRRCCFRERALVALGSKVHPLCGDRR